MNHKEDYVKSIEFLKKNILQKKKKQRYFMIKDQIKLYGDFSEFHTKCLCCEKSSHTFCHCPIIHYMADRDFLIKKSIFSKEQIRTKDFLRKKSKKRMKNLKNIQENAIKATISIAEFLNNENEFLILENPDENDIEEEYMSSLNIKNESEKKIIDFSSKMESFKPTKFGQNAHQGETSIQKFPTNSFTEVVASLQEFNDNESGSPKENNAEEGDFVKNLTFEKTVKKNSEEDSFLKNMASEKKVVKNSQKTNEREKIKDELFMTGFDEIKNFSKYFPEGNIGNILRKMQNKSLLIKATPRKSIRMSLRVKRMKNASQEGSPELRIRPLFAKSNVNIKEILI